MQTHPITEADRELIDEATAVLREHFAVERHEVASALRTESGATYAAINLVASVNTAGVHCEPITVANAVMDGEDRFETTVAVTYAGKDPANEIRVISACGVCRELLRDFDPATMVLFREGGGPVKAPVSELLPAKS